MYVVVPAGGSGTRLWPLSRATSPKFLHALTGDHRSLLQTTVDRLAPLTAPERTFVVTGAAHAVAVARQLPLLPDHNVLVEPAPRESAPAIGLAAALIHREDPDAIVGSFAADHLIEDEELFRETVRAAVEVAREGYIVTVGIAPTGPGTGYGYIRTGGALGVGGGLRVEEFKEKPSREVAEAYVASGRYLWNASMFVCHTRVLLGEIERQLPELSAGLGRIAEDWATPRQDATVSAIWPALPKVTIDHGVMEHAERVATIPGRFGWNDVGDWDTLASILPAGDGGNVYLGEGHRRVAVDTRETLVVSSTGRVVATLGVEGLVIVDTEDALLVSRRERAQEVKSLVDAIRARDWSDLL